MMKHTTLIAASLVALASPALALSCLQPDVARSYSMADEAEETYVVVRGTLSFNEARLPKANGNSSPASTKIKARFDGMSLTRQGFTKTFQNGITLDVGCLGPWCAGAASGEDYLLFLRKDGTRYTYAANPCGGYGFIRPTDEMLKQVQACMQGRRCEPAE